QRPAAGARLARERRTGIVGAGAGRLRHAAAQPATQGAAAGEHLVRSRTRRYAGAARSDAAGLIRSNSAWDARSPAQPGLLTAPLMQGIGSCSRISITFRTGAHGEARN